VISALVINEVRLSELFQRRNAAAVTSSQSKPHKVGIVSLRFLGPGGMHFLIPESPERTRFRKYGFCPMLVRVDAVYLSCDRERKRKDQGQTP
jgi:hypothetical protein